MRKKLLSLVLGMATIGCLLSGCGKNTTSGNGNGNNNGNKTETSASSGTSGGAAPVGEDGFGEWSDNKNTPACLANNEYKWLLVDGHDPSNNKDNEYRTSYGTAFAYVLASALHAENPVTPAGNPVDIEALKSMTMPEFSDWCKAEDVKLRINTANYRLSSAMPGVDGKNVEAFYAAILPQGEGGYYAKCKDGMELEFDENNKPIIDWEKLDPHSIIRSGDWKEYSGSDEPPVGFYRCGIPTEDVLSDIYGVEREEKQGRYYVPLDDWTPETSKRPFYTLFGDE